MTTASLTSGWFFSPASMFLGAMFFPPAVIRISFLRPVIVRKPSLSNAPRSPEMQPPVDERLGGRLGFFVVAEEDVLPTDEDLAVGRDLHVDTGTAGPTLPSFT